MKDELIKFETAKLAKKRGFGRTLDHIYPWSYKNVSVTEYVLELNSQNNTLDTHISAPTQSLLQRWLMIDGRHLFVRMGVTRLGWYYDIIDSWTGDMIKEFQIEDYFIPNYRDVYEKGLQEALKLIE